MMGYYGACVMGYLERKEWVSLDEYDVSTKSIVIFMIELGICVIRVTGKLGCSVTFFDGGWFLWMI